MSPTIAEESIALANPTLYSDRTWLAIQAGLISQADIVIASPENNLAKSQESILLMPPNFKNPTLYSNRTWLAIQQGAGLISKADITNTSPYSDKTWAILSKFRTQAPGSATVPAEQELPPTAKTLVVENDRTASESPPDVETMVDSNSEIKPKPKNLSKMLKSTRTAMENDKTASESQGSIRPLFRWTASIDGPPDVDSKAGSNTKKMPKSEPLSKRLKSTRTTMLNQWKTWHPL